MLFNCIVLLRGDLNLTVAACDSQPVSRYLEVTVCCPAAALLGGGKGRERNPPSRAQRPGVPKWEPVSRAQGGPRPCRGAEKQSREDKRGAKRGQRSESRAGEDGSTKDQLLQEPELPVAVRDSPGTHRVSDARQQKYGGDSLSSEIACRSLLRCRVESSISSNSACSSRSRSPGQVHPTWHEVRCMQSTLTFSSAAWSGRRHRAASH